MTIYKQVLLGVLATIVTVLYFWYLGYNVMILDNPLVDHSSHDHYNTVIQVSSWE